MRSTGCVSIAKIVQLALLLAILSPPLHAMPYPQETVTLNVRNASLEKVLKEIRRQTGYLYALQDQWKEKAKPIDIAVDHAPLDEALRAVFKGQPFTYAIVGKTIVIKEKEVPVAKTPGPGPLTPVKGIVYNEAGEPLAEANITIKEIGRASCRERV